MQLVVPKRQQPLRRMARYHQPQSMGIAEMQALEDPLFAWIAEQPDSVEGVASFLDKRNPRWNLSAERDFPHHLFP